MPKFDDTFLNTQLADLHAHEEERLVADQALQLGYQSVNLHNFTINPEAMAQIREKDARDAEVVAFSLSRDQLGVAAREPNSPKAQAIFKQLQQRRFQVDVYLCSRGSLEHAYKRYKDITDSESQKKGVFEIDQEDINRLAEQIHTSDDVKRILTDISNTSNVRRISETLELIFAGALAMKVSDIHIEPKEEGVRLRYRFDGVLHDIAILDRYIFDRLMTRLKLLSGMVLNTRAEAQDGRFTFDIGERKIEIRSSVIPGAAGESIVMRLLDPSTASFNIDNIDLNPYIEKVVRAEIKKPNGLIITTGPTGSGKTTALYSFLREAHTEGVKIITIENPVEYKLDGIVQTQIGPDYSFASGLRAILRQDPDIIMVGEIRDREVAETAIHAAQTGHLVFSTLHTNSAIAAFARLIDLGVDPRVMGASINLILGQRLIRLLCNDCKQQYAAPEEEIRIIEFAMSTHPHPTTLTKPLMLYRPGGCEKCNRTGYKGRIAVYEGVQMDPKVEEAVLRDPRESVIGEASKPQGIPTMLEDGIEKVVRGITSLRELERVIELPFINPDLKIVTPTSPAVSSEITSDDSDVDLSAHVV
jgi:type II secretory ATPase GspE/PulE/Tfp pilus assembly ATPase PilB-like protein